jgi:hypothetical protein
MTSGQVFVTIFDNINIFLRKSKQRLSNSNDMINATNCAVVGINDVEAFTEADLAEQQETVIFSGPNVDGHVQEGNFWGDVAGILEDRKARDACEGRIGDHGGTKKKILRSDCHRYRCRRVL